MLIIIIIKKVRVHTLINFANNKNVKVAFIFVRKTNNNF